jgi:hypothetical protein
MNKRQRKKLLKRITIKGEEVVLRLADPNFEEETKVIDGVVYKAIPKIIVKVGDGKEFVHPAFVVNGGKVAQFYLSKDVDLEEMRKHSGIIGSYDQNLAKCIYEEIIGESEPNEYCKWIEDEKESEDRE